MHLSAVPQQPRTSACAANTPTQLPLLQEQLVSGSPEQRGCTDVAFGPLGSTHIAFCTPLLQVLTTCTCAALALRQQASCCQ